MEEGIYSNTEDSLQQGVRADPVSGQGYALLPHPDPPPRSEFSSAAQPVTPPTVSGVAGVGMWRTGAGGGGGRERGTLAVFS